MLPVSDKLTPSSAKTVCTERNLTKRRLIETSPENMGDQVGSMTKCDLMQMMTSLLDEKFKNIATKTDILDVKENINEVKSEVSRLSNENKHLQNEIQKLKDERENDQRRMMLLEKDFGKKKLIFRGLESQTSVFKAVKKVFQENLKMENPVEIEQTRKLYEKNQKMTVMVELKSTNLVTQVLKHTKNLAGTSIHVERDLCKERQEKKKVMLYLKKEILKIDRSHKIIVRDDNMIINKKQMFWNQNKALMCGHEKGEDVLKSIYGEKLSNVTHKYNKILENIISKN